MRIPGWIEPAFWGVAIGAMGWWIILAYGFGWMSAATAAKMSGQKAQDAVVAYAAPVCVARFEQQPNAIAAWQTLKKTDEWDQSDLVVKKGWVAEPGQELDSDTENAIASSCATKILALKTLGGVNLSLK